MAALPASTAALPSQQHCQHDSNSSIVAWQLYQHCQHGSMAAWQHGSMVAWPLRQHCQHGSMATMPSLPAWGHCHQSSYASNSRQLCQQGSFVSVDSYARYLKNLHMHVNHLFLHNTCSNMGICKCDNCMILNFLYVVYFVIIFASSAF